MFFSKRSFFSTIGLAMVVTVSGLMVIKSVQKQISQSDLPDDFIIGTSKDLVNSKTNVKGNTVYVAKAKNATLYQNQDSLLSTVNMILYDKNNKLMVWDISSNYAKITNQNNNINLYGNVILLRKESDKKYPDVKIKTESANYYSKKDLLMSARLITITQPGTNNVTTGSGMIASPNKGDYKLLKNVRSYYENS